MLSMCLKGREGIQRATPNVNSKSFRFLPIDTPAPAMGIFPQQNLEAIFELTIALKNQGHL
jgi:hypothetical protein